MNENLDKNHKTINIFYSYSHKDEKYHRDLERHLSILKRQNIISDWHDRMICAGNELETEINKNLMNSDIILLLISPNFIASDYCYDIEMQIALQRHNNGDASVIPIIVKPSKWDATPFAKLKALPKDGKPITLWRNRDEAWLDIVNQIQLKCNEICRQNNLFNELSNYESNESKSEINTTNKLNQDTQIKNYKKFTNEYKKVLEKQIFENYELYSKFAEKYKFTNNTDEQKDEIWILNKYKKLVSTYIRIYFHMCEKEQLPFNPSIVEIATSINENHITEKISNIANIKNESIYTYLNGTKTIQVEVSQLFRIADLLIQPENVRAKKFYDTITNIDKMRRTFNKCATFKIGELGELKPIIASKYVCDNFWRMGVPDFRFTSNALCFIPFQLNFLQSKILYELNIIPDSILESSLLKGWDSIQNKQISARLRIYPPGVGVIKLKMVLSFKNAVNIEIVSQIARNVEELLFVDPDGLKKPCETLFLEIIEEVIQNMFLEEGFSYDERRWRPPNTTFSFRDDFGFNPEENVDELAYLLSLAPQNQENIRFLRNRIFKMLKSPHWKRDKIFTVVGQGVSLSFIKSTCATGRRNKIKNLYKWIDETCDMVSAAAYAEHEFEEEIEKIAGPRLLDHTWLEDNSPKLNYLLNLIFTMRNVMQAIFSIKKHLQKQGTGILMAYARDIWTYNNPVNLNELSKGLDYILNWIKKAQAQHSNLALEKISAHLEDIKNMTSPFSIHENGYLKKVDTELQEELETQILVQLSEINNVIRDNDFDFNDKLNNQFKNILINRRLLGI